MASERRSRILVVDDEASNRDLLDAMLSALGHDAELAEDGAEALAKLDATHDLILLDVMMAGMDGYEVARRVRADSAFPDIPICMVTALSDRQERLRAVEAGANDFITKPIDKLELKVRTTSLLKAKAAQDTIKRYQAEIQSQNERLQETCDELQRVGRQKDQFIGIASHDLKNPLTCILAFASVMSSQIPPGTVMTTEMHEWIANITKHCRVMQKIIEDFLDFQAIEDGQILLKREAVDLNELAREVLERNSAYATQKRIATHLDLAGEALWVNADRGRMNQVLENFVSNAIKFSPPGEQVTIVTRQTPKGVRAEVRDSGPGIDADDMKKLFVKYAKLKNAPTGGEKSTGLGLAICRQVIELQGGATGAQNNPDRGAAFWFELPATPDVSAA